MEDIIEILRAKEKEAMRNAAEAQEVADAYRVILDYEDNQLRRDLIPQKNELRSQELPETQNKTQFILDAIKTGNGPSMDDLTKQGGPFGIRRQYIHTVIFKLKERQLITERRKRFFPKSRIAAEDQGTSVAVQ